MSVGSNISRQLKSLKTTLKKHGKHFKRAMRINNIITKLKDKKRELWEQTWWDNGTYVNEQGQTVTEVGVGWRHQNLSAYLRKKKKTVSNAEYRRRAEAVLEREGGEIRGREIVDRANAILRAQARIYAPGVEIRLAQANFRGSNLSIEQIEEIADINDRIDAYRERAARAPIILEEILAEADIAHAAMMDRIELDGDDGDDDADEEDAWGIKKKTKKRKRRLNKKTKKRRKQ